MKTSVYRIMCANLIIFLASSGGNAVIEMSFERAYDLSVNQERFAPLARVERLKSEEDRWLQKEGHKEWFLGIREKFPLLSSLDLARQGVADEFIQRAAEAGLERIEELDLSWNPQITGESLRSILDSDVLGSVRGYLQNDGRYGRPFSEIEIRIDGTAITKNEAEDCTRTPHLGFNIEHRVSDLRGAIYNGLKRIKVLDPLPISQGGAQFVGSTGISTPGYGYPGGTWVWVPGPSVPNSATGASWPGGYGHAGGPPAWASYR